MSRIQKIQSAIGKLSSEELEDLYGWLEDFRKDQLAIGEAEAELNPAPRVTESLTKHRDEEDGADASLKSVTLYTDGACIGNPGPGGYAAILIYKNTRKEISGGFRWTTNNRMELMAAIAGLEAIKERCRVTLHTDSQYVQKAMELGWANTWKARGWRLKDRKPTKNVDLWKRLMALSEKHDVKFKWVRGHAGHPENERCDEIATAIAARPNLPEEIIVEAD